MSAAAGPVARSMHTVRRTVHLLHGTRGLTAGIIALLALVFVENLIPEGPWRAIVTFPALALLLLGMTTLPREGVAVQDRLQETLTRPQGLQRLARHLFLPAVLVFLLMPKVFLGAFGIPHMSPITGLVPIELQSRMAVLFLFLLLWLPVLTLRRTRSFAPEVEVMQPHATDSEDPRHHRRQVLLLSMLVVVALWAFVLQGFWRPFSLLTWFPGTESLQVGVLGVARFAFAVVLAACLYVRGSAYVHALVQLLTGGGRWRQQRAAVALVVLHILLVVAAAALHLYNLLWIVDYQLAARF